MTVTLFRKRIFAWLALVHFFLSIFSSSSMLHRRHDTNAIIKSYYWQCDAFATMPSSQRRRRHRLATLQEEQASSTPSNEEKDDSSSSQEQYLKLHQRVRKRRVLRRLLEIGTILSGQVFRPLLCSLTKSPPRMGPFFDDWDAFWLKQEVQPLRHSYYAQKKKQSNPQLLLTNAQRVAQGLPNLGPTWTKLGQALATRPDILHVPLADALANLQDNVSPFDNMTAKRIIRRELEALIVRRQRKLRMSSSTASSKIHDNDNDDYHHHHHQDAIAHLQSRSERRKFLDSLSEQAVASGTIAQVYKGDLPGFGPVAIKVQRPGIRKKVENDATLFHSTATWLERLKWPRGTPLEGQRLVGSMQIVKLVDEFTSRVFEDMDFVREARNMQRFADMYSLQRGSSETVRVVVPEIISELCSDKMIVMEWIEGAKLTDISGVGKNMSRSNDNDDEARRRRRQAQIEENLAVVKTAIECTLSQLFEHGLLHADPHTGNLLKVKTEGNGPAQLGYLDFGLVSEVPQSFRDGIVCAVVQIVFARNINAVADLCVDLGLLPREKLKDPVERQKFVRALRNTFDEILVWPKDKKGRSTAVPKLCSFQQGLAAMTKLIASYEFTVPPYFLNNCRALATLEGIGLKLDPSFNILHVIYPYSINQLMCNPRVSKKTEETFLDICRSPETRLVDVNQAMMLLNDWSILTEYPKRKIFWDLATSTGGRHVSRAIIKDFFRKRFRNARAWYLRRIPIKTKLHLQMIRSLSFPLFVVLTLGVGAALSFQPVARQIEFNFLASIRLQCMVVSTMDIWRC